MRMLSMPMGSAESFTSVTSPSNCISKVSRPLTAVGGLGCARRFLIRLMTSLNHVPTDTVTAP
ncbi:hypothetical protein GCM10010461_20500 [Microbacterium aurantiacum]